MPAVAELMPDSPPTLPSPSRGEGVFGLRSAWGDGPGLWPSSRPSHGLRRERAAEDVPPPTRVVGYLADWTVADPNRYRVEDVPADRLTHLNLAFAQITGDGGIAHPSARRGDLFAQLRRLKAEHPHLKTLISVGGWGGSRRFSDVALTDASRAKFAASCVEFITANGFDGVDIDWEFPVIGGAPGSAKRPEDKANFTKLLGSLRAALDARAKIDGRPYLLTIAAPAGPPASNHMELKAIADRLDWINLMDYDFAGPWSDVASFQAPLFAPSDRPGGRGHDVESSVRHYLAAGIVPDKLVVGVPFYGRGWVVADARDDGLFQRPAKNPPRGFAPGAGVAFRDIPTKFPGATRRWDEKAQAPYLVDPARKIFFGFDDAESLRLKAAYVREHHLGGLMIWELSQDDPKGTLIRALAPRRP